jgi:hypothetical protein
MKLFLVHCGFYDAGLSDGIYESHVNFFVAADDFDGARAAAKEIPDFKTRRMHVDGIQEIAAVSGHRVRLERDAALRPDQSEIIGNRHRDLAPKPAATTATS